MAKPTYHDMVTSHAVMASAPVDEDQFANILKTWGGWVTGGTARQLAADQSQADVTAALSLICVDQSKEDPQVAERVAALKAANSWSRGDLVMKNGWATMPGTTEADRQVARACAEKIAA